MMDWLPLELLGPIALLAALLGGRVAMHWRRRYPALKAHLTEKPRHVLTVAL
jgi:hypothetical protein